MKASVFVVSYNTVDLLRQCLASLFANTSGIDYEVFVVDNVSADGSADMVRREFPTVRLIANTVNVGFAAANNQAYRESTGEYLFLLNPDAEAKPDAVNHAVDFMEAHPEAGMCGGRIRNPDGGLDPSARRFPGVISNFFILSGLSSRYPNSPIFGRGDYKYFDHQSVLEVDWVPGTFTAIRRSMIEQIGFFDERFYLYYEETDLCLRARRAGWKIYFIPDAEILHEGGACSKTRADHDFDTSGSQLLSFRLRSEYLYFRKNHGLLSVLGNAVVEIGWHLLRIVVNAGGGPRRAAKRQYSRNIVANTWRALCDTGLGRTSPPCPW